MNKKVKIKAIKEAFFAFFIVAALGVILYPILLTEKTTPQEVVIVPPVPQYALAVPEVKSPAVEPLISEPEPTPKVIMEPEIKQGWIVRVGTFAVRENAEKLAEKLKKTGSLAYTKSVTYSGKSLTLVLVGPQPNEEMAQEVKTAIEKRYGLRGQVLQEGKS